MDIYQSEKMKSNLSTKIWYKDHSIASEDLEIEKNLLKVSLETSNMIFFH